jgi:hypothetical protein
MRNRISIVKEDRIWDLRSQGYCYDTIARLANCNPSSMTIVIRRVRNRPPLEEDPIKRGRYRGFLSDSQVEDIRARYANGESVVVIADDYQMSIDAMYRIIRKATYKEPCNDGGYPFDFTNRLTHRN